MCDAVIVAVAVAALVVVVAGGGVVVLLHLQFTGLVSMFGSCCYEKLVSTIQGLPEIKGNVRWRPIFRRWTLMSMRGELSSTYCHWDDSAR